MSFSGKHEDGGFLVLYMFGGLVPVSGVKISAITNLEGGISPTLVAQRGYQARQKLARKGTYKPSDWLIQCHNGLMYGSMIWLLTRYPQDGDAKKDSTKVWFNAALYYFYHKSPTYNCRGIWTAVL